MTMGLVSDEFDVDALRERVRERMATLGLSQNKLAKKLHQPNNAWVSNFLSGRRGDEITAEVLARLARALEMNSSELLGEVPHVEREPLPPTVEEALQRRRWSDGATASLRSWVRKSGQPPTLEQCIAFLEFIEANESMAEVAALVKGQQR